MQLKLGKNGIEEYLPIGDLSPYEKKAMDEAVTILQGNVKKGAHCPALMATICIIQFISQFCEGFLRFFITS